MKRKIRVINLSQTFLFFLFSLQNEKRLVESPDGLSRFQNYSARSIKIDWIENEKKKG